MNWAAMNYVKRLRRENGINGNLRFLLMMIAGRIPKGFIETKPTSLGYYAQVTGNDRKTIKNLRDKLIRAGQIRIGQKGGGRGKLQTYIMPALAGPLFMVQAGDGNGENPSPFPADGNRESLTPIAHEKGERLTRGKGGSSSPIPGEKGQSGAGPVRTQYSREDVRTKTTTAEKPVVAVICDETLSFLNWFPGVYAQHQKGAQVTIDYESDGPRVQKLLIGPPRRELARLQAMAVAMLTVTSAEDKFLADAPDRGLRLLAFAADRFERIAVSRSTAAQQRLVACRYRHDPPCLNNVVCAERERQRLAAEDAAEAEAVG